MVLKDLFWGFLFLLHFSNKFYFEKYYFPHTMNPIYKTGLQPVSRPVEQILGYLLEIGP